MSISSKTEMITDNKFDKEFICTIAWLIFFNRLKTSHPNERPQEVDQRYILDKIDQLLRPSPEMFDVSFALSCLENNNVNSWNESSY